jgi:DNA-binding phage protein
MLIGQVLLTILQSRHYPISQFAHDVGMARSQLYKIIKDEHSPTLFTLERLVTALDMSMSEFFGIAEMGTYDLDSTG